MFDRLIAASLRNRWLVLAATLLLFIAAAAALRAMPTDVFPEFAPPQVVIQTEAPGLPPGDVEALITYPLESAINGAPGVDSVRSKTSAGLSTITVVFAAGSDIYLDRQLINERLQNLSARLPAGSQAPVMLPVTSAVGWLVKYALYSDDGKVSAQALRTLSDWTLRPRLLALGGIASVVSIGGEVRQYQVRVDPLRLQAYGISLDAVRTAVRKANLNAAGGFLQQHGEELIISGIGRVETLDDLRNTVVTVRDGVPIHLGNVCEVAYGAAVQRGDAAYGLQAAVVGTISKAYGADTLQTTRKVEAALHELQSHLPPGVHLQSEVFRQADFIEAAIHNLRTALLQGALIVIAVLFLFLMNARASLITFLSMPASFAGGVLVLHGFDIGINSMTLGGMAIAIGEVVDNGIVSVENVVRRLRLNRAATAPSPVPTVIYEAVREILNSVVYATLIIVLIFLPIFFLQDLAGRIFRPLGLAYIAAVAASLAVAVSLVPALCAVLLSPRRGPTPAADMGGAARGHDTDCEGDEAANAAAPRDPQDLALGADTLVARRLKQGFRPVLQWALRHTGIVVAVAMAALVAALTLLSGLGRSFLPEFHEGNFVIAMTLLPGTSLDESMRLGARVRADLLRYPQVVSIDQRAGRSELDDDAQAPNFSEFDVRLDFARAPTVPAEVLIRQIRSDLSEIPGAAFNLGQFIAHRMDEVQSGVRSQVAIKLFGDDLPTLFRLGQQTQALLETVPGAVDINLEQQISVPQLDIRLDRARLARYGMNVGDVAEDLQTLLNGTTVSSVIDGAQSVDLVLRLPDEARDRLDTLRDILIDAPALGSAPPPDTAGIAVSAARATAVPLREIADLSIVDAPYAISRENVRRVLVVGFNVEGRDLAATLHDTQAALQKLPLPPAYYLAYGGQFESQQQAHRTLLRFGLLALFGAALLLYQAFGRLRDALLVLCNLPLALIGGVVALALAGASLSVAALIGFITLFGIAARNGIILVSHYQQLRASGRSIERVVVEGTLDRLIPVLMTALTAALGLVPLLFGSPVGKELEVPLAQVVCGGLFSATSLNLLVVPTLYLALERRRERLHGAAHSASLS